MRAPPRETITGQFAVRRVGDLLMAAYAKEIGEACFLESVESIAANIARHGPARIGVNVTDFIPGARQRTLTAANEPRTLIASIRRFAIISDDPFAYGVVSSIAWMLPANGPGLRHFHKRDCEGALEWLHEVVPFHRDEARAHLHELRTICGV